MQIPPKMVLPVKRLHKSACSGLFGRYQYVGIPKILRLKERYGGAIGAKTL